MYKIVRRIENIKSFTFFKDKVIGICEDQIVDLDSGNVLYLAESSLQEVHSNHIICYVNDINGNGFYFKDNSSIIAVPETYIKTAVDEKHLLVSKNDSTQLWNIELDSFTQLSNDKLFTYEVDNGLVFYKQKDKVKAISLFEERELWCIDLSGFGLYNDRGKQKSYAVKSILGIWKDLLLVQLSNFRLIALDLSTGNLKHDLLLVDKFATESQNYLSTSSPMLLDTENERIVWLSNSSLIHIDLTEFTPKLIKDYFNVPKENLWRFNKSTLYNGYLYFTGDYGMEYAVSTRVGVLNPETGEVLWQEQLEKTGGLSSPPQVDGDKLYVLGSKGILHIFEKD